MASETCANRSSWNSPRDNHAGLAKNACMTDVSELIVPDREQDAIAIHLVDKDSNDSFKLKVVPVDAVLEIGKHDVLVPVVILGRGADLCPLPSNEGHQVRIFRYSCKLIALLHR